MKATNNSNGIASSVSTPPGVCIESAQCLIPRRGRQEERRRHRDKLRQENPEQAAVFEAHPWYVDPDSEFGSDDYAICNIGWNSEADHRSMGTYTHVKISDLHKLKETSIGAVVEGGGDQWWEYCYHIRASFALELLKDKGHVAADATLAPANWHDFPVDEGDARETCIRDEVELIGPVETGRRLLLDMAKAGAPKPGTTECDIWLASPAGDAFRLRVSVIQELLREVGAA